MAPAFDNEARNKKLEGKGRGRGKIDPKEAARLKKEAEKKKKAEEAKKREEEAKRKKKLESLKLTQMSEEERYKLIIDQICNPDDYGKE